MIVRAEKAPDEPVVRAVVGAAFGDEPVPELLDAMRESASWLGISFVAEHDGDADRAEPLVFLEGSPAYYPRFGFVPGGTLGFSAPSVRIPDAAFQVLTLASYEPWMRGALVYPEVFWAHDTVGLRESR